MEGNIRILQGNLLDSEASILAHQTNCRGVMGAGVAKAISRNFREVYPSYKKLCSEYGSALLGKTQFIKTSTGTYIANCFAQDGYGTARCQTDYTAFRSCMQMLLKFAEQNSCSSVALPYKIGCGLAGGDWAVVNDIIQGTFADFPGTIELWRLESGQTKRAGGK